MNTIGFNTKRGKCFALVAVFAMVACAFTVALAEENTAQTMAEENTAYVPIGKVYPVATTIPTAVASTHVAITEFQSHTHVEINVFNSVEFGSVDFSDAYVPIGKVPIAKDPSNRDLSTGTALDAYVPIGKVYPVATTIPTAVASTHVAIVDFN